MAYVYDYASRTQFVYVNGRLDASRSSAGPYKGVAGDLTIGTNGVCSGQNHWDGCIDQVSYFSRAKKFVQSFFSHSSKLTFLNSQRFGSASRCHSDSIVCIFQRSPRQWSIGYQRIWFELSIYYVGSSRPRLGFIEYSVIRPSCRSCLFGHG